MQSPGSDQLLLGQWALSGPPCAAFELYTQAQGFWSPMQAVMGVGWLCACVWFHDQRVLSARRHHKRSKRTASCCSAHTQIQPQHSWPRNDQKSRSGYSNEREGGEYLGNLGQDTVRPPLPGALGGIQGTAHRLPLLQMLAQQPPLLPLTQRLCIRRTQHQQLGDTPTLETQYSSLTATVGYTAAEQGRRLLPRTGGRDAAPLTGRMGGTPCSLTLRPCALRSHKVKHAVGQRLTSLGSFLKLSWWFSTLVMVGKARARSHSSAEASRRSPAFCATARHFCSGSTGGFS